MVKVTPHSYSFDSDSWFPHTGDRTVLELYFVGDTSTAYRAWPGSWLMDDRHGHTRCSLPGDYYGTDVCATADEVALWFGAQQAAAAALRDAETQLLHDVGLMEVRDGNARQLRGAPGWKALARRLFRSRSRAAAEFRSRSVRIQEEYAPVRDEIVARVRKAEQQDRERWERVKDVEARARWRYEVNSARGVVHVFYESSAPLSTAALKAALLEVRRDTGVTRLRWNAEGRAEIERRSGVDFDTWWCMVSPQLWESSRIIPLTRVDTNGRAVHVSAHTSFGVGMTPPSVHF